MLCIATLKKVLILNVSMHMHIATYDFIMPYFVKGQVTPNYTTFGYLCTTALNDFYVSLVNSYWVFQVSVTHFYYKVMILTTAAK